MIGSLFVVVAPLKSPAQIASVGTEACAKLACWSNRLSSVDLEAVHLSADLPAGVRPWGCSFLTSLIDYEGNVHSCCEDFRGELIEGNIKQESLASIRRRVAGRTKETFCGFFSGPCRTCAGLNLAEEKIVALLSDKVLALRDRLPKWPREAPTDQFPVYPVSN